VHKALHISCSSSHFQCHSYIWHVLVKQASGTQAFNGRDLRPCQVIEEGSGFNIMCASVDRECRECILKQCHSFESLRVGEKVSGRGLFSEERAQKNYILIWNNFQTFPKLLLGGPGTQNGGGHTAYFVVERLWVKGNLTRLHSMPSLLSALTRRPA
jgi:hypothetical protein